MWGYQGRHIRNSTIAGLATAGVLAASATDATPPQFTLLPPPTAVEAQERVQTGSMPKGVAISPDGQLYVTNYGQLDHGNVSVIDSGTLQLLYQIDVPGIVVESEVSPDGRTLYVSNFRRNSVQFVDLGTRQVVREVSVGSHPKVLVLSHDGRRLFAANWGSQSVTEIDTRFGTAIRTLSVQDHPRGMALTRSGRLYVANFDSHSIDIYEGARMERHHRLQDVCRIPRHLVLSPDESRLYISCLTDSLLAVMDTASEQIIRRVTVGRSPKANAVTPDGRYVVTANYGGSSVSVVDTTDWHTNTVDVPGMDAASGIVTARRGFRIYVTGWYDDHVYSLGRVGSRPHYTLAPKTIRQTLSSREYHRIHAVE